MASFTRNEAPNPPATVRYEATLLCCAATCYWSYWFLYLIVLSATCRLLLATCYFRSVLPLTRNVVVVVAAPMLSRQFDSPGKKRGNTGGQQGPRVRANLQLSHPPFSTGCLRTSDESMLQMETGCWEGSSAADPACPAQRRCLLQHTGETTLALW